MLEYTQFAGDPSGRSQVTEFVAAGKAGQPQQHHRPHRAGGR